jgi:hypothetical protein
MNTREMQLATLAGALVAGLAGGYLSGLVVQPRLPDRLAGPPPAVRAGAFEAVDEHGRVRARLGQRGLDLLDGSGRVKATLRLQGSGDQGTLGFSDDRYEGVVVLGFQGGDVGPDNEGDWALTIHHRERQRPMVILSADGLHRWDR